MRFRDQEVRVHTHIKPDGQINGPRECLASQNSSQPGPKQQKNNQVDDQAAARAVVPVPDDGK